MISHLKTHAVAWVALFFALGGGGGFAVAATTQAKSPTVHACVSKRTGALYVAKKCSRSARTLVFNQRGPAGATGATGATGASGATTTIFGSAGNGNVSEYHGMTITPVSTGVYNVMITAPACATTNNVPVVSADGGSTVGPPEVFTGVSSTAGVSFTVFAGNLENGSFVETGQGFNVIDECGF